MNVVMIIIMVIILGNWDQNPALWSQSTIFSTLTLINTAVNIYNGKYLNIKINFIQPRINKKLLTVQNYMLTSLPFQNKTKKPLSPILPSFTFPSQTGRKKVYSSLFLLHLLIINPLSLMQSAPNFPWELLSLTLSIS